MANFVLIINHIDYLPYLTRSSHFQTEVAFPQLMEESVEEKQKGSSMTIEWSFKMKKCKFIRL